MRIRIVSMWFTAPAQARVRARQFLPQEGIPQSTSHQAQRPARASRACLPQHDTGEVIPARCPRSQGSRILTYPGAPNTATLAHDVPNLKALPERCDTLRPQRPRGATAYLRMPEYSPRAQRAIAVHFPRHVARRLPYVFGLTGFEWRLPIPAHPALEGA